MLEPDAMEEPRPSFVGSVNVVIATYALDGILALITGAIVARALGAEGRGAYGLFVLSAALGQVVLGLGIGNAAIYYLNKRELSLREVLAAVHVATLWSVAATAAVVAVVSPWASDDALGGGISVWLLVAVIPALLYVTLMRLVLQALSRFVDLGVTTVGHQLVLLVLVAIAYAWWDPVPRDVVLYLVAACVASGVYSLVRLGLEHLDAGQIVRPRMRVLRSLVGFGVQGEAGNALQLLNYRLDQYIVRLFVGLAGVGIYAVGASMMEAIFVLANAVALVLLPRLTSLGADEAARTAPVACRNTMMIAATGAAGLAVIAPVLIPAVFGDEFSDSVQALWLLLPGAVALTGSKVLTSYIFSQGRPFANTLITAVSLAVTLAADFALIPAFGVNGAAVASSIGYTAHFAAALYAYQRISGRPARDALLPRRSDIDLYRDAARNVLGRWSRRSAGSGEPAPVSARPPSRGA